MNPYYTKASRVTLYLHLGITLLVFASGVFSFFYHKFHKKPWEIELVSIPMVPAIFISAVPAKSSKTSAKEKAAPKKTSPAVLPKAMDYKTFLAQGHIKPQKTISKTTKVVSKPPPQSLRPSVPTQAQNKAQTSSHTQAQSTSNTIISPSTSAQSDASKYSSTGTFTQELYNCLYNAWENPLPSENNPLAATVRFKVDVRGNCSALEIIQSSGNTLFDQSIQKAFQALQGQTFHKTPEAGTYSLTFKNLSH